MICTRFCGQSSTSWLGLDQLAVAVEAVACGCGYGLWWSRVIRKRKHPLSHCKPRTYLLKIVLLYDKCIFPWPISDNKWRSRRNFLPQWEGTFASGKHGSCQGNRRNQNRLSKMSSAAWYFAGEAESAKFNPRSAVRSYWLDLLSVSKIHFHDPLWSWILHFPTSQATKVLLSTWPQWVSSGIPAEVPFLWCSHYQSWLATADPQQETSHPCSQTAGRMMRKLHVVRVGHDDLMHRRFSASSLDGNTAVKIKQFSIN